LRIRDFDAVVDDDLQVGSDHRGDLLDRLRRRAAHLVQNGPASIHVCDYRDNYKRHDPNDNTRGTEPGDKAAASDPLLYPTRCAPPKRLETIHPSTDLFAAVSQSTSS
jgi:hypothetical protein